MVLIGCSLPTSMSCPVSERSATCHTLHLQLAGWSAERRVEAEAPSESRGTPDASLAGDDGKTIIDVDRVSPSMSQSIDSFIQLGGFVSIIVFRRRRRGGL